MLLNHYFYSFFRAPAVLFIDEIDSLCPVGEHRVSRDKDLTRAMINGIELLKVRKNNILWGFSKTVAVLLFTCYGSCI